MAGKVLTITIAMGVDFGLGHGEWSYEDIIDVTGEISVELIMTDNVWAVGNAEVTTDELSIDNDLEEEKQSQRCVKLILQNLRH